MKKVFRWLVALLLLPILLTCMIVLALYTPPVQQWGAQWGAQWLHEHTGYGITFDRVRVGFPLRLQAEGLYLTRDADTLVSVERVRTDMLPRMLYKGYASLPYLQIDGATVHTGTWLTDMQIEASVHHLRLEEVMYRWKQRTLQLADINVKDAEVAITQSTTTKRDSTSKATLPLAVCTENARITHIGVRYRTPGWELSSRAQALSLGRFAADTSAAMQLHSAVLQEGTLLLTAGRREQVKLSSISLHADSLSAAAGDMSGILRQLTLSESGGLTLEDAKARVEIDRDRVRVPYFTLRTENSDISGYLHTSKDKTREVDGYVAGMVGHVDILHLSALYPPRVVELLTLFPAVPLSFEVAVEGPLEALQLNRCHVASPTVFVADVSGMVEGLPGTKAINMRGDMEATIQDIDFVEALLDTAMQQRLAIPHDIRIGGQWEYAPDELSTQLALQIDDGTVLLEGSYRPRAERYALTLQTQSLDMQSILPAEPLGSVSMWASIEGEGYAWKSGESLIDCRARVDSLVWAERLYTNALLTANLEDRRLHVEATYADTSAHITLRGDAEGTDKQWKADLHAMVSGADLRRLGIAETEISPTFSSQMTLTCDSLGAYNLRASFYDIALTSPERTLRPMPMEIRGYRDGDSIALAVQAGDLYLLGTAQGMNIAMADGSKAGPIDDYAALFEALRVNIHAGSNNPISNYLSLSGVSTSSLTAKLYKQADCLFAEVASGPISLKGITTDTAMLEACYRAGTLEARVKADDFAWSTEMMSLDGTVGATVVWHDAFRSDSLQGMIRVAAMEYALPTYSLNLHAADTLLIPFRQGSLILSDIPLYAAGKQPLYVNGTVRLLSEVPSLRVKIDARGVSLLQRKAAGALLYGRALLNGSVVLEGAFDALRLSGSLALRDGSSVYYLYKDAQLTANRNLNEVVTFVDFAAPKGKATPPRQRYQIKGFNMNINIDIVPTAQLQVLLGTSGENTGSLQGGGNLNVQYIPGTGLRLSGKYTIASGELAMNIPLLHVHSMTIRPGSTVQWSGNALNPMLDVAAENRIRASVMVDDMPQNVLFVAGMSFTDTLERLGLQFTLSAPENASMQNLLAALSPDERSKLAVALLTTGLYLGEGGTGNLMNTALLGFLQSQLDNISRDTFRSVDVSFGIEPLRDGISGISTRTDYSFSVAKRFWRDRIRVVIGGSVTTSNERIEEDAIIDNISIEWRIAPGGSQYLRFFYDKNFESILEGEIRETGVGYVFRRKF